MDDSVTLRPPPVCTGRGGRWFSSTNDAYLIHPTPRILVCPFVLDGARPSVFGLHARVVEKSQRPQRLRLLLCPYVLDGIRPRRVPRGC